jgi:D-glycero-D-manno-heptose 1,7-bisphosphate phosphatase
VEKKKLGTAGALSQLKTKNNLMVINGDSFSNLNINSFINKDEKNYYAKMLLLKNTNYKSNNKLSNLRLEKKTKFISFGGKLMNGGIYLFKNQVLKIIKKKYSSLEEEVIPSLIKKKKIKGFFDKNYFIDIGTYTNLNLAKNNLNKFFRRPAAFLDRDGVINENKEYVCEEKRFFLKKNVLKAIKYLNKKKIYVFIITNQAGIGKGYYTEEKFLNFQRKIKTNFLKKNCYINDLRYCPYHKSAIIKKYKKNSMFRKPGNLMIKDLQKNWSINMKKSFMIGDSRSDMLAAKKSLLYFEYDKNNLLDQVINICKKIKI